jgi:hypothetical protein
MRFFALALVSLALCNCRMPFSDQRGARWVRADVREATAAYAASEADHLSHNYMEAYIESGRDMTCDDHWLPVYSFECIPFPHN